MNFHEYIRYEGKLIDMIDLMFDKFIIIKPDSINVWVSGELGTVIARHLWQFNEAIVQSDS